MLEPSTGLSVKYLTWAVASAYLFQDPHCACLKWYGPNFVLLHSGIPVRLYYVPVWGHSECIHNPLRYISYHLQVDCTHIPASVAHVYLPQSTFSKYRTRHIWVTKSMDAVTAGDHWSRRGPHLSLQLPLPLSLICFGSLNSQWICNDRTDFCVGHGGWQVFKTAERSGSAINAGCGAGYIVTSWVCF